VRETVAAHGIERVLVFSSAMAQYADPYRGARRVVDFCDVDSDKWRQYADKKSWPMSWLYGYEAAQPARYERQVAREYDASLFVSAPEAELFRSWRPKAAPRSATSATASTPITSRPEAAHANPYAAGRARAGVYRRHGLLAQRRRGPVVRDERVPGAARTLSGPALLHRRLAPGPRCRRWPSAPA
jgi:hypothetical protein